MKKLYAILAGTLFVSAAAHAQRMVDMQATLVTPTAGGTVTSGQPVTIKGVLKNVGSVTLKATDTVGYFYLVDNNYITDGQGNPIGGAFTGRQLMQNDTVQVGMNLTFGYTHNSNGSHNLCVAVQILNRSADSVRDNNTTNNSSCSQLNFTGGSTVGVNTITASRNENAVMSTYPVPVRNEANFDVYLTNSAPVSVRVMDLAGRTLVTDNKGQLSAGKQSIKVDMGNVPSGIYLYQIQLGNELSSGKLTVVK